MNDHDTPILIQRLDPDLPLPTYEHPGDAGLDLRARVNAVIEPGARFLMPTGLAIALEPGFAAFVHARSGLAMKKGLGVANGTGVVDAGYRGEIGVPLVNLDRSEQVVIARGDRIAQLVIAPVAIANLIEVSELPGSQRAHGGFGSTGGHAGTVSL